LNYLVAGRRAIDELRIDAARIVAQGEGIVFEGSWPIDDPIIARMEDTAIAGLGTAGDLGAFAVEAIADPGSGAAFVIGAHRMLDAEAFRPYAEQVEAIVRHFRGRFLARAGKVTPLGGAFVPGRAVIIEFPTAADAVAFYVSDVYAPLLKIRHAATDPRFVVLARSGSLPAAARAAAESYLRSGGGSAH
jgi:uncharacterized protein (DUF1330 family)